MKWPAYELRPKPRLPRLAARSVVHTEGAALVNEVNRQGAASFGPGSRTCFEVKDMGEADGLAFWTGFQVAEVEMKEAGRVVPMRLRVTEVFRLTGGDCRMIVRHASMATDGSCARTHEGSGP